MPRAFILAVALFATGIANVQASLAPSFDEFLGGTGTACLTGGALFGLTAFFAGPAALAMASVQVLPATAMTTTGVSAMLGCGAGAVAALAYYGYQSTYDFFYGDWEYPLVYPLPTELSEPLTAPARSDAR